MYLACQIDRRFFLLLEEHVLSKGRGRLVAYADGLTTGNELHCGQTRKDMCVYWTLLGLPDHWIFRQHGWFTFGIMPDDVLEIRNGTPQR